MNKCRHCNKKISIYSRSRLCRDCWIKNNYLKKINRWICQKCGKKGITYGAKLCQKCYIKTFIGKTNPNFKDFRSFLTQISKKLRKYILKRDNYRCRLCNNKKRLEIHHKIPVELFSLKNIFYAHKEYNLITLCRKCHNFIHEKH